MGFLDIFRSREPEKPPEKTHEVMPENLPKWVDVHFSKEIEAARIEAKSIYSDARETLSDARETLSALEKSTFGGRDKGYVAANMAKDSFARRTSSILNSIRLPEPYAGTYSGLMEFKSMLKKMLTEVNATSPKQGFLLSRYFKDESVRFAQKMKALHEKINEIESFLCGDGMLMKMAEDVNLLSGRMKELTDKSETLRKGINDAKKGIAETKALLEKKEKELGEILRSTEWKSMEKAAGRIEKMKQEMSSLEADANQKLSAAKRPLKKLGHMLQSRETLPDNMFREVILHDREPWLAGLLKSVLEHAGEGSISLKDKEKEKLLQTAGFLESGIPGIKKEYKRILAEMENSEKTPDSGISKRVAWIEREISEMKENLKERELELDSRQNEMGNTEAGMKTIKQKIENMVRETAGKSLEIRI